MIWTLPYDIHTLNANPEENIRCLVVTKWDTIHTPHSPMNICWFFEASCPNPFLNSCWHFRSPHWLIFITSKHLIQPMEGVQRSKKRPKNLIPIGIQSQNYSKTFQSQKPCCFSRTLLPSVGHMSLFCWLDCCENLETSPVELWKHQWHSMKSWVGEWLNSFQNENDDWNNLHTHDGSMGRTVYLPTWITWILW